MEFPSSYFGESLPYPINLTTTWEQLRPLTYKQALADTPYFAPTFQRSSLLDRDLTPESTPWVIIGCSYSGVRAALSRQSTLVLMTPLRLVYRLLPDDDDVDMAVGLF